MEKALEQLEQIPQPETRQSQDQTKLKIGSDERGGREYPAGTDYQRQGEPEARGTCGLLFSCWLPLLPLGEPTPKHLPKTPAKISLECEDKAQTVLAFWQKQLP